MNSKGEALTEAQELIDALLEGQISEAQARRLEALVITRQDVRRHYVLFVHHEAMLASHLAVPPSLLEDDHPLEYWGDGDPLTNSMVLPAIREESPSWIDAYDAPALPHIPYPGPRAIPWYIRHQRAVMGTAAAVLVGALLWFAMRDDGDQTVGGPAAMLPATKAQEPFTTVQEPTVIVVQAIDARWEDLSVNLLPGEPLKVVEHRLESGLVRLRFSGGADIIIEGPARFEAAGGGRVRLMSGRLSAHVPPSAIGFTVVTPTATVVDRGTEFGVEAEPVSGTTEALVFEGEVELDPVRPAVASASRHTDGDRGQALRAGEARRVNRAGAVLVVPPREDRFVRRDRFEAWDHMRGGDAATRWKAASERLARDPTLVMYYVPIEGEDGPERVANRSLAAAGRGDAGPAPTGAPTWAAGRWPNRRALAFDPAAKQGLLVRDYVAAPKHVLTVAAWVNARSLEDFATVAKNWGASTVGQFHLGLVYPTRDMAIQITQEDGTNVTVSEGAASPFPTERWVHVATVADGRTLRLYRDGRLVGEAACSGPRSGTPIPTMSIGYKTGNDGFAPADAAPGFWDGAIGELAIWHRALPEAEIRRLYNLGRPQP